MIAGEKAGSKLAKANQMGIRVIHEAELLEILKQEATVEVAAPAPKKIKMPKAWADARMPGFKGRVVYLTGKLGTFTRAQTKHLLEASGTTVVSAPNAKTTDVISGDKWSNKLREAIAYGATIWSEGELLLALEGNPRFPLDLKRDRLHVNWASRSGNGTTFWMYEQSGPNYYFGDVCTDELNLWVMVDLERGLYAVNAHTGPYIINPDNP